MNDLDTIREYLASPDSWTQFTGGDNEDYVQAVAERMATLRREHPDGEFPAPIHGLDDIGACTECDALKCLGRQAIK